MSRAKGLNIYRRGNIAFDYQSFEVFVQLLCRYRFPKKVEDYIANIVSSAACRAVTWQKGQELWRAQRGCKVAAKGRPWVNDENGGRRVHECEPYDPNRMKPEQGKAKEGRVNPKGITCLYCATHENTAMSEVRPWHHAKISVARLELIEDVRLVDCSRACPARASDGEEQDWTDVCEAFSRPVCASDDVSEYVATQILAEAFREGGYGGIIYDSGVNDDGKNVALFDTESANVVECSLYTCESVKCVFKLRPVSLY